MDKKSKEWANVKTRFDGQITPSVTPTFSLSSSSKVITIGSCFARNIEEHLNVIGVALPTYQFLSPYNESPNRPNGVLNKFTPTSIKEELEWAIAVKQGELDFAESIQQFRFDTSNGQVIDLQLNYAPISEERFVERRRELLSIYDQIISSDCMTITLGLVERWLDRETGLSVYGAPNSRELLKQKGRFYFSPLTFIEAKEEVERIISVVREVNPEINFLITTSPVPLNKTFKDQDVVIANSYSKSTLRAVCGEICSKHENVDYFPSYEMVTFRDPESAFGPDLRHVNDHVVGDVVQLLVDNYFTDVTDFDNSVRKALGDLTAKRSNTEAMNYALDNASTSTLSKTKILILARVAWRCGRRKEAIIYMKSYFRFEGVDPRDLRSLNFIATQTGLKKEYAQYLEDILAKDPQNERATKFLSELSG